MSMNLDRLVQNKTGYVSRPFHQRDARGYDVITIVAKLTWELLADGTVERANPQRGIRPVATYRSSDGHGSLRYPSDSAAEKPGTDVIMLAKVYPAVGPPQAQRDVTLRVHREGTPLEKTLRAFGARQFVVQGQKLSVGDAMPLVAFPICYEMAKGGMDREVFEAVREGKLSKADLEPIKDRIYDESNPCGRGCAADVAKLDGKPAHQLEIVGGTEPAGFGAVDGHWACRRGYAGTRDEAYFARRHPVAPKDQDPRYNCYAHPDLWSETPLRGDERIEIIGAVPEQTLLLSLPYRLPRMSTRVAGEIQQLDTHLDTIIIDVEEPGARAVELTWRASIRVPKKSERLEWIRVNETELG